MLSEGEAGQVFQGNISSRDSSEDELRAPLAVAEQRGFESLRRDFSGVGSGDLGDGGGRRVSNGSTKNAERTG